MNDAANRVDVGVSQKRLDCPPNYRLATERSVLLGAATDSGSATGSNDQGRSLHTDILPLRGKPILSRGVRQRSDGRATSQGVGALWLHYDLAICKRQR